MAEAGPFSGSVTVTDELRALYRASGRRRVAQPPVYHPAPTASLPHAPGATSRPATDEALAFASVRLRRTGRRPLVFRGALLAQASTADDQRGWWHDWALYLADDGACVVQLAQRSGSEAQACELHVAERVVDADGLAAAMADFDPAAGVAPAWEDGGLSTAALGACAEDAAARRADYAALCAKACAPDVLRSVDGATQ